ncbi:ras-related protein Rab-33B-like [Myripristis murdjan]|uniref:RAB33B, member RAS onco family n=1 Tax=Myripristis murdjan TaxID=586833 RepID=A0A667WBJ9_9TELE|nr:ras-related protein Rab-33B-like [Myripristis murdjan]XP_029933652.1 ras-related protein Rab-33B-like [Myripristis murdjan]
MESSLEFSNSLGSVSSLPARCRTFKIIVIGDSAVGKTCLTHRLCAGEFPRRVEATIGVDFRERLLDVEGERIKLQMWDTAGQERFRKSMVQHYYRNVHAVLFVYDVTCPASFRSLPAWVEECRQNSLGLDIPRFLVGNKSDLRGPVRAEGQVSREQALKFAEAHGMTLFETSAKSPANSGPKRRGAGEREAAFQQDKVDDIITAVAARLKRLRRPTAVSARAYCDSFKVPTKKMPEKDLWSCTC